MWLYHKYGLSIRDVEDVPAERGNIVSYEAVRQWRGDIGPDDARQLKRRCGRRGETWFVDEVFITITGQRQEPVATKLGGYRVANRDVVPWVSDKRRNANNLAEVSHQLTRQR